jgi:hypothetical protein
MKEKVGWRKLGDEEIHTLHSSPNSIRVIKPRRMRKAVHVSCMGDIRNAYKI